VSALLLYEHEDGRYRVAPAGNAAVAGDPRWHRMGPVEIADPCMKAAAPMLAALRELVDRDLAFLDGSVCSGQITRGAVLFGRDAIAQAAGAKR
jgi:hypothetical protein